MASRVPRWSAWEMEVADMFEGSLVVQSGRLPTHKGDVSSRGALIDCKYTDSGCYRLSEAMWDRLCEWAVNAGREPVVAVSLAGEEKVGIVRASVAHGIRGFDAARDAGCGRTRAIRKGFAPSRFSLEGRELFALGLEDVASALSDGR